MIHIMIIPLALIAHTLSEKQVEIFKLINGHRYLHEACSEIEEDT